MLDPEEGGISSLKTSVIIGNSKGRSIPKDLPLMNNAVRM